MKIALHNLEPEVINTAMMQISQFHKQKGDSVEWYSALFHHSYNKIYCSSIFDFSNKDSVTSDMVCGGTGFIGFEEDFNVLTRLPPEIEKCDLDYSLYSNCHVSFLWFSRGCINNCPFCIVPKLEGKIHSVIPKKLNSNGKVIYVMDPNFFANPKYPETIRLLIELGQPVDFQQGIDARIFTPEHGKALDLLQIHKQVRTAWDNPKDDLTKQFKLMMQFIPKSKIMVYVLIGYWSTPQEDLERVMKIRELGLDAYVMPYNKQDPYQKAFTRWNNRHVGCEWEDYDRTEFERLKRQNGNQDPLDFLKISSFCGSQG